MIRRGKLECLQFPEPPLMLRETLPRNLPDAGSERRLRY
jgi:hypothetical protein